MCVPTWHGGAARAVCAAAAPNSSGPRPPRPRPQAHLAVDVGAEAQEAGHPVALAGRRHLEVGAQLLVQLLGGQGAARVTHDLRGAGVE